MRHSRIILIASASVCLSACASPKDTVIFVTNTSLGINVESKPPTASIAYDRTEGYVGPRTANGGLPPVIASLQTSGDVFEPKVRTLYATGDAAVAVASPAAPPAGNGDLTPGDNKVAFFGTTTAIGLKVGFDPTTSLPDSLVLGFKRKELSVIPLGTDGGKLRYPSVIASIDTTVGATSLQDTGLTISQYFATGQAANVLAGSNVSVRQSFQVVTANAATATLTTAQQAQAQVQADGILSQRNTDTETVMGKVAPGGTLDIAKLNALIASANAATPGAVNPALSTGITTAAQLRLRLGAIDPAMVGTLAKAASSN
jgi:hypothetical protein